MTAIIVDDEVNNIDNLRTMLERHCPQVHITGAAASAAEARKLLAQTEPDLLFVDIQMPKENGFQLLQSLPSIPFEVIFVTAYDQYGIQAIKMSALDYLLKPLNIEDLKAAVAKAEKQLAGKRNQKALEHLLSQIGSEKSTRTQKLALPTGNETRLISITDIIRCESSNSYTTFFLSNKEKIIVSRSIKEYEELLSPYGFIRVHQSHLVNKEHVVSVLKKDNCALLMKDGAEVPVSRQKKDVVLKMLDLS